jgi:hypothetical protein
MVEEFAKHPVSVLEVISERSGNAADWTPRDALINLLREIDSGEVKPDALVICLREAVSPGVTSTSYRNCGPDIHTSLGLLEHIKWQLLNP